MNTQTQKTMIEEIASSIDIPETAYDKAKNRYKDLGDWFGRSGGKCSGFDPQIYSQGSFRLGTVVRPLNDKDEYDLDVGCRLRQGVSKARHTQKQLKGFVGDDLEEYRKARRIENLLDERNRCWRLQYADELCFHMDVVPSIPDDIQQRQLLEAAMIKAGTAGFLAQAIAKLAGAITDKKHPHYEIIAADWRTSNSEGYALWFESRMKLAAGVEKRAIFEARAAQVDPLPTRKWNSPLQQCVKILKRHRDIMFQRNPDGKPISVIITTLAAGAYGGEEDIEAAMQSILSGMGNLVRSAKPRVPNPVNPTEDFADKWSTDDGRRLKLEENFWGWLKRAQDDFRDLGSKDDAEYLTEQAIAKFGAALNARELGRKLAPFAVNIATVGKGLASQTPNSPVDLRGGGRNG